MVSGCVTFSHSEFPNAAHQPMTFFGNGFVDCPIYFYYNTAQFFHQACFQNLTCGFGTAMLFYPKGCKLCLGFPRIVTIVL